MEERSSFALLVGSVVDATTTLAPFTPQAPYSPIAVTFDGIGTPPVPSDAIGARAYSNGGFVLAFDAGDLAVDEPSSSGPSPKHLTGSFVLNFTISAAGYADLAVTYPCSGNALPIVPAAYALQPAALTIRGAVTAGGAPVPGASVSITAAAPAIALPPATTTDANGLYGFDAVPAAQSITIAASGAGHNGSQTVAVGDPDPIVTVNFVF
jgi:hypothetical protein